VLDIIVFIIFIYITQSNCLADSLTCLVAGRAPRKTTGGFHNTSHQCHRTSKHCTRRSRFDIPCLFGKVTRKKIFLYSFLPIDKLAKLSLTLSKVKMNMNRKNIIAKCTVFVLPVLFLFSPLAAQNSFHFDVMMGINLSHPIASPVNETAKGQTYSVQYIPGYNWAGVFSFKRNKLVVGIGLGYNAINFNQVRTFVLPRFPIGASSVKSETIARLNYLCLPIYTSFMLNPSKGLYISINTEFCSLVNDVYDEILTHVDGTHTKYRFELHQFFDPHSLFLFLGAGMQIKSNKKLAVEIGFTPESNYRNRGGLGNTSYFNFSKRIMICRITFMYELICFTF